MASGICIDWNNLTIILVENTAPEKPLVFGLPGGIIGQNETPEGALIREWKEEVWGHGAPDVRSFAKMRRSTNGGLSYFQHLFLVQDNGREMRKSGVRGETKAPARVSLWAVAKGEVEVFHSHKIAIHEYLKEVAPSNKDAAFMAIMMAKKLKIEI